MHFGGLCVALAACLGWNDSIHNESQLVKVGFHTYPRSSLWTALKISVVNDLQSWARKTLAAKVAFEPRIP